MKKPPKEKDLAEIIADAEPHPHWLRWTIILLLICGCAAAAWYFFIAKSNGKGTPTYSEEPIRRGDISLTVTATGNLEPTNTVTIGSEISGLIKEVLVDSNDRVQKGTELAKVDTTKLDQTAARFQATLDAANARVTLAQATLDENEATLARRQELHKLSGGQTPSKADMLAIQATVARSKAEVDSANASVSEAQASLRTTQTDIAKAVIRSPVTGIVLTRKVEPGQTVAAQFTAPELFIIAEKLEVMKLKVAVSEADIGRVKEGQEATFTVDTYPDRTFKAKVMKVSFGSQVLNNVVTYDTELEVPNEDGSLRPGMTATAEITVGGPKGVLLAPNMALRFDPERAASAAAGPGGGPQRTFVQSLTPGPGRRGFSQSPRRGEGDGGSSREHPRLWVLKDGKPVPLPVKIGVTDGKNTEVSGEGVTEGMEVVVSARYPAE